MNRGLPVSVEAARGLDSRRRPEGSRPLGTRMAKRYKHLPYAHALQSEKIQELNGYLFCNFLGDFKGCLGRDIGFLKRLVKFG